MIQHSVIINKKYINKIYQIRTFFNVKIINEFLLEIKLRNQYDKSNKQHFN